MTLKEKLINLRHSAGISQRKLADALGVPQSTIKRIEQSQEPCFDLLCKIANYYSMTLSSMFYGIDQKPPK
jgi:transcriptional regulator with XRE-family HTH domain|tara:strand:+ start:1655 stop:1867 length:213 start_codon:yes stop_codon:yes gene_type:complete